jgi:UDP-glucose 4-epimerase
VISIGSGDLCSNGWRSADLIVVGFRGDCIHFLQGKVDERKYVMGYPLVSRTEFAGLRVLVTGGAGFIASHLTESLVGSGANVTVVDSLASGNVENLASVRHDIQLAVMTVIDALSSGTVKMDDFDIVFHAAANAYIPPSVEDPAMDFERNLLSPFHVLEAIRKASRRPRLVFFSTAAVYGNPATLPMREGDLTVPISPYGVSKLATERYLDVFSQLYGIKGASLRLFSVYGPRQRKQVVFDLLRKVRAKTGALEVYGDGSQERDLVFVMDVVQAACVVALNAPANGETYNVASGTTHSISTLVSEICRLCDEHPRIDYTGHVRPGDAEKWSVDISRLKSIGYEPKYKLADGLALVRDWYDKEVAG